MARLHSRGLARFVQRAQALMSEGLDHLQTVARCALRNSKSGRDGTRSRNYKGAVSIPFCHSWGVQFEFDPAKSLANLAKHGIDFEQAQALWQDQDYLKISARTQDEPRPGWSAPSTPRQRDSESPVKQSSRPGSPNGLTSGPASSLAQRRRPSLTARANRAVSARCRPVPARPAPCWSSASRDDAGHRHER